ANMPGIGIGARMRLVRRIKVAAGRATVRCRAIAEFMDMKPMVARSKTDDFCVHLNAVGDFSESDSAANLVAICGVKHGDRLQRGRRFFFRRLWSRGDRCE